AQAVKHDFAVTVANAPAIVEICRRVDGLPLATELAAARIAVLSPEALLARLGHRLPLLTGRAPDPPTRPAARRGTAASGHDRLEDADRTLFRRLAVFAGGFTLEAAEAVCGPQSTDDGRKATADRAPVDRRLSSVDSVLDGLASLAGKSLLERAVTEDGTRRF